MQINLNESKSLEESRKSDANGEKKVNDLSRIITKDSVAAAGIDVDTPIVNAIIGTLTGTLPTNKQIANEKILECRLCNLTVTSQSNLEQHVIGAKHRRKLKNLEDDKLNEELKESEKLKENEDNSNQTETKIDAFSMVCEICSLEANSEMQLRTHLSGKRHKRIVNLLKNFELGSEIQPITCQICKVWFNSTNQERQHKKSKKHKMKEALRQKIKDTNPKKSFQPEDDGVPHKEDKTKSNKNSAKEVS